MHEKKTVSVGGARSGAVSDLRDLYDIIISTGPRVPEALEEVVLAVEDGRSMLGHLQSAGAIISGRASSRDIHAELTADELAMVEELESKLPESSGRRGLFSDLFAFLKANPELLQLVLLFLKK